MLLSLWYLWDSPRRVRLVLEMVREEVLHPQGEGVMDRGLGEGSGLLLAHGSQSRHPIIRNLAPKELHFQPHCIFYTRLARL
jgi:hypothetical protein